MQWLVERWSSQACLIHGRWLRETIPAGKTAADVLLMRWVDLEYCADDGGDVAPRYMPGMMPLRGRLDRGAGAVDYVLGTLELSAAIDDGRNAFGRHEPYPPELVATQERRFAAVAELFAEDLGELAQDPEPRWYLVAGEGRQAQLVYGALVDAASAEGLPEGVLHLARGQGPKGPHPRVAVGALVAAVGPRALDPAPIAPDALAADRYLTTLRVIRNFWPHAKTGFIVVPSARPNDRPSAAEPSP